MKIMIKIIFYVPDQNLLPERTTVERPTDHLGAPADWLLHVGERLAETNH